MYSNKIFSFILAIACALFLSISGYGSNTSVANARPDGIKVTHQVLSPRDNLVAQASDEEYTLPPLPYAYDALNPYIDTETMTLHHDKHHGGYVKNLNEAIASQPQLQDRKSTRLNSSHFTQSRMPSSA